MKQGFTLNTTELERLAEKYAENIPRYTSYPTAVELQEVSDEKLAIAALKEARDAKEALSLYLHIPFCPQLCYFCACNKTITQEDEPKVRYLEALEKETARLQDFLGSDLPICQMHFGGGSPSYLSAEQLQEIDSLLRQRFSVTPKSEYSIEIDPRNTTPEKISAMLDLGFNRISMGVQDFSAHVQEYVNRIQPYELTAEAVNAFRSSGIKSINLDLIYGLPGQDLAGFQDTLQKVLTLRPERIALYGYAHVRWKVKVQTKFRRYRLPTPHERLELFAMAVNELVAAGYEYIGLDHFALPDDELVHAQKQKSLRRNFMGYTVVHGAGVLGIGASSISDVSQVLIQNHPQLDAYHEKIDQGALPVGKVYSRSKEDSLRGYIIERLMCDGELSIEELEKAEITKNAPETIHYFVEGLGKMEELAKDKLVELSPTQVRATPLGRFFLRLIVSVYDEYLPGHLASGKPRFSQAL